MLAKENQRSIATVENGQLETKTMSTGAARRGNHGPFDPRLPISCFAIM
jgi:hypothetical protein